MATAARLPDVQAGTLRELRQVLAELELVSQVPALDYASKNQGNVADERSPGGKRPRGGDADADDGVSEFALKSVDHFSRRLAGALARNLLREQEGQPPSSRALEAILADAKAALAAHRRQPAPKDRPDYGSPQWKRWVAESDLPAHEIARIYNMPRSNVERVRQAYRAASA